MELGGNSLLPSADEQETALLELNTSTEMDLLSQCQSHQVEGAVIIYDAESQQLAEEDKSSDDPDNFITLHASTDVKTEAQEEVPSIENKDEANDDTDDDETIATFVTSTGQQLALYAVEDSDEIFAVALYDESGEPPTNFHFLMKADVERLIGEGAVKTVKKPQAQPNKQPKPAEKKEEIKFERLSDLKAKAEKEEAAAAAQLKKVRDMQTEKKEEAAATAQLQKVHEIKTEKKEETAATIQLQRVHEMKTEKQEEAATASQLKTVHQTKTEHQQEISATQFKKVHEIKTETRQEAAAAAQLKRVHDIKTEKQQEAATAQLQKVHDIKTEKQQDTAATQLKKVHDLKTNKQQEVATTAQSKKVHDIKTEKKEGAAATQLKKIHEIKTEIVEVPGPQPKVQNPKPQCKIVQRVEQKKIVSSPNHNLINRNINSPNISTITKTTKIYGNVNTPSPSAISKTTKTYGHINMPSSSNVTKPTKTYGNINMPSTSNITKATKIYGNINTPNVSNITKTYGNINTSSISTINKTTKSIGNIKTPSPSMITKTTKSIGNVYQPRIVEPKKESKVAYVVSNDSQYTIDNLIEDLDSDAEIIEQSTVQYILCDGDPSDSEMTFDELQASLQSFKANKPTSNVYQTKTITPQKMEKKKETIIRYSSFLKSSPKVAPILSQKREPVTTIYRTYSKGPKKARMTNNLLHPIKKIKQEIEDPSYCDTSAFDDSHLSSDDLSRNTSKQNASMSDTPGTVKVKRPRKQQLTLVNRTDSEIIIQSTYSEGEEEPVILKKRGRRRKKLAADPDYNPRKPIKKSKKANRSVEVIEIDVDESEKSGVQDSTIEGNKGKGSSDKENETISVNDSEAEAEAEKEASASKKVKKPMMQCTDCNRNFRKRKVLEKHVQVCPKSPAYIQKMEERKQLAAQGGKRFKCKSCDEMFDIAVALARHVRVVHSLKKKGKQPKGWSKTEITDSSDGEEEEEEEDLPEESMEESSPEPEPERKKRGRPPTKRSLVSESPSSNIELKLDSSTETVPEPKRRGRPPGRKSAVKERSVTPDLKEKESSTTESRKRGRPSKQSVSKERSLSPEPDDKSEDTTASSLTLPKKRGRPAKRNLTKDDERDDSETGDKNESSIETDKVAEPTTLRKRGRPVVLLVKTSFSKDGKPICSEADEKYESSDEMPLEVRKKSISSKRSASKDDRSVSPEVERKNDSSDETPLKVQKQSGVSKTSVSKDDMSMTSEAEEDNESSDETPLETRKKARASKVHTLKDDSSVTPEANEKNESLDETPLNARTKAMTRKVSISKEEISASPQVKGKVSKTVEDKSEEVRSAIPDPEKKKEKTVELNEETRDVSTKETTDEAAQGSKEKPIAELPKKRKLSQEECTKVDDPASAKTEDNVDISAESSDKKVITTIENILVEEESGINMAEEKSGGGETPSDALPSSNASASRPSVEEEIAALMAEEKPESSTEILTESRKLDKSSTASRTSVEEKLEVPEVEEKEKPVEVPESSTEIRIKSRLSKDVPSTKDDEPEISETKESSDKGPTQSRKRGMLSRERPSKDGESGTPDTEEKTDVISETPRKRGRPRSSKSESVDDSVTKEEKKKVESPATEDKDKEKAKKKVPSPNRTWKVKKLNCEDCGKWFSSATLLRTHRLQHRTKKSARLDADRCPLCRKSIPSDLFAKHMATVHKKSPTSAGATRRPDVGRVSKPARKPRSARTLRSSS